VNNNKKSKYKIIKKARPTFYFIGVTTSKSSIMKIFPSWMKEIDRPDITLKGIDLKIHDKPENYRQAVAQIKYDNNSLGALVTTHKMDLYSAAEDMFDYFDDYASLLNEVSSISKNNGRLEGHAKDPISSGLAFEHIVEKDYFTNTNAHLLIFGAGGSSIAIILYMLTKRKFDDKPGKIIVVNRSQPRLDHLIEIIQKIHTCIPIEYICNQNPRVNNRIMSSLPPYSVVINATGMGKDTPGSPVTDRGLFPEKGIAWEFNYRGELNFMHQAEKQIDSRGVKVEDGWMYFIYGWTQVISQVLHLEIKGRLFDRFVDIANNLRKKRRKENGTV
jgi:shikimate 5-dehydrogenase